MSDILAPIASLSIPDAALVTQRAQSALQLVETFVVDSPETYQLAADELKAIKARADKLEEQRTSITKPINAALKAVNDLFRGPADLLARAEQALKRKMLAYSEEQERIAAEERRKAEAAAAEERRRLAEQAEAERKRAEEAAAKAAETNDPLAAARAAEHAATAATLATTAQVLTAPVIASVAPKVKGVSTSETWDFEVVDMPSIIKHIAAHPELSNLLTLDTTAVRQYVRSLKANTNIPGLRVFPKKSLRA